MLAQSFSFPWFVSVCRGMSFSVPSITDSLLDPDCIFDERSACLCFAKQSLVCIYLWFAGSCRSCGRCGTTFFVVAWRQGTPASCSDDFFQFRRFEAELQLFLNGVYTLSIHTVACTETNVLDKVWTCSNVFDITWQKSWMILNDWVRIVNQSKAH